MTLLQVVFFCSSSPATADFNSDFSSPSPWSLPARARQSLWVLPGRILVRQRACPEDSEVGGPLLTWKTQALSISRRVVLGSRGSDAAQQRCRVPASRLSVAKSELVAAASPSRH